ncbi:MAG: hypothetical protein GWN99_08055 [Gemmatimonadetes bacterium]|uniref:Uncharacterized protein n=1 Tax=Candidatus Kutchimonas denitrificans TaxID=3056748 RepID=A0AAE4ZCN9_9BACT|nr:hypothetical protein [Gemmatimonadota bacterium]NIR75370.1 hypothetical protein [Candidatus Kutchimonas denitrificans]NIS01012.1 hypothetical protein [Gemmatimonadota bacterium]NIT66636.1 hypothetical protein [Gemmatimonadota bacterium]NIU53216.1 hypothetical protein [Gemmatimonadota bacterium]
MEIDLAVVADAANVSQEGKLNVMGVFDTIWAREFPFRHAAMVFVLRVRADFTEQGDHGLVVRLMDADGGQLFKAEGPLKVPQGTPGRPLKPHVILGLAGITFQRPGDYSFEVMLDGDHLKSIPLHVMKAPTPPRAEELA